VGLETDYNIAKKTITQKMQKALAKEIEAQLGARQIHRDRQSEDKDTKGYRTQ